MELRGQVAIVTGSGRGIGEEIALTLAREGAHVVVNDINTDDAGRVAKKIEGLGVKPMLYKADVTNKAEVKSMVRETISQFGTIDILVNNAGIAGSTRLIQDIPEEVWDRAIGINLKGIFLVCQAVIPIMAEKRGGKIVNISSAAGRRMGFLGGADYTASKYGVIGFSYHLAYELAMYEINVNVVCPGLTLTPMAKEGSSQEIRDYVTGMIPLGRLCDPKDQAEAVLFLVSERSKMITGHVLDVNGGVLLGFGNYMEDMKRRIRSSNK
jgi:NAD(P)-dependent dehydrogenase (short-subunit alcohol dehydrogenase family)